MARKPRSRVSHTQPHTQIRKQAVCLTFIPSTARKMLTTALSCPCPALAVLNPLARPRSAAPAGEPPLASPLARPSRAGLPGRRGGTALPEHPSPPPRRLRRASASLPAEKLCAQLGRAPRGAGTRSAHGGGGAGAAPPAVPLRLLLPAAGVAPRSAPLILILLLLLWRRAGCAPRFLAGCGALLARSLRGRGRLRARGGSAGPAAPALAQPPSSGQRGPRAAGRGRRPAGTPLRQLRAPLRSSSPGLLLPPALARCEGTRLPAHCWPGPGSTSQHGPAAGPPGCPSLLRQAAEETLPALPGAAGAGLCTARGAAVGHLSIPAQP